MIQVRVSAAIAAWLALASGGAAAEQQSRDIEVTDRDGVLRIVSEGSWSLERAVVDIQRLCGCPIGFENPALENQVDLVDDTAASSSRTEPRALRPRPGRLVVTYSSTGPLDQPSTVSMVQAAVREYEREGLPGRFKVDVAGDMIHVVPVGVMRVDGQPKDVTALLDSTVSLPREDRSVGEAVQAIVQQVEAQSGRRVRVVNEPIGLFLGVRSSAALSSAPARIALARLFESLPKKVSWRVRYRAGDGDYTISFDVVPEAASR